MDNFIVSARKYRPSTFNSVVGQDSITNTLKNAIKSKHLAQAFLFCGPRGVGKTTCARILAKTINCTSLTSDTEGCNECESCVSFNNGQSMNIFELDAASNNSVDDMRNLVDQVRYAPQSGNFKIYIIDEVHMLSTAAFNAFLKTLEEPPPYAIFILATTEKHKIIPTILSRCQIFDFNRITIDDIAAHLVWVAQSENIIAESEALHTIAQKADGALRDALSIFDQIVSFAGNNVTYRHVIENLNILDYEYFFRICDFILQRDYRNCLLLLNEIIEEGFDVHHFISGLCSHFRDLLVSQDVQTIPLLEVSESTRARYKTQSKQFTPESLFRLLDTGNQCDVGFKSAQNQRLHVELALLKMCTVPTTAIAIPLTAGDAAVTEKKIPDVTTKPVATTTPAVTKATLEVPSTPTTPASRPAPVQEINTVAKEAATPLVQEQPKPSTTSTTISRNRSTGGGTVSITKKLNASKPVTEIQSQAPPVKLPQEPLEKSAVVSAIKELVVKLQSEGRRQLAATLNKHEAILRENNIIEILVDNPVQAGEIQENRVELLGHLKNKLVNGVIELHSRVVETGEGTVTAYTPVEKFNQMAEKNPELNQLRQQFDLEFDY